MLLLQTSSAGRIALPCAPNASATVAVKTPRLPASTNCRSKVLSVGLRLFSLGGGLRFSGLPALAVTWSLPKTAIASRISSHESTSTFMLPIVIVLGHAINRFSSMVIGESECGVKFFVHYRRGILPCSTAQTNQCCPYGKLTGIVVVCNV